MNLLPKFALGATLLAMPIVWTSLQWATYSVQQGGEIKGARVFKNQMFIIVGSMISVAIVLALIAWSQERAVGTAFFNAVSHSYYYLVSASGEGIGSVRPFPGMMAIVISPNPIITILVAVSFMLASLQITCNCYIGMTRVMVGMSLDRTLPAFISKISPRFRSPAVAHWLYFGLQRAGHHPATATGGGSSVSAWASPSRVATSSSSAASRQLCFPSGRKLSMKRRRAPSTRSGASRW